jgi:hypothetical protein
LEQQFLEGDDPFEKKLRSTHISFQSILHSELPTFSSITTWPTDKELRRQWRLGVFVPKLPMLGHRTPELVPQSDESHRKKKVNSSVANKTGGKK